MTPEMMAFTLWPMRRSFRFLHTQEFATEMSLYNAVKADMAKKFYTTLETAVSFYKELNQQGIH